MKATVPFLLVSFAFFLFSCNNDPGEKEEEKTDTLYVVDLFGAQLEDGSFKEKLIFTGDDIVSFNITTREITLNDSTHNQLQTRRIYYVPRFIFYFNGKPLFDTIPMMSIYSSNYYNNLIIVRGMISKDSADSKFSLEDGYPVRIPNSLPLPQAEAWRKTREENIEKRKAQWDIFIQYLSEAGKIVE